MESETHRVPEGATSGTHTVPLDVRIVARLFYIVGGLVALSGILLCIGVIEPQKPYRALFGAVILTDGLTQGLYALFLGLCCWFLDWGLTRRMKSVWWFLMVSSTYYAIRGALVFPDYPVAVTIGTVGYVGFIVWLWFRRGFYGVRVGPRGTGT